MLGPKLGRGHQTRVPGGGHLCPHTAIDDHPRLAHTETPSDEQAATNAAFPRRAQAWFSTHGITIHRALRDEEAHHPPYPSEAGRHHALTVFLDWHDFHRPHTGIDGQTRASHVTNLSGQHT